MAVNFIRRLILKSRKNIIPHQDKKIRAEWWRRLIGFFIDAYLATTISFVLHQGNNFDFSEVGRYAGEFTGIFGGIGIILNNKYTPEIPDNEAYNFIAAVYCIYVFLGELIFSRTLGKLITRTQVVDPISLLKPKWHHVIIRTFCRLIPLNGFSFISFNPYGWHDSISKTIVINSNKLSILKNTKLEQNKAKEVQKAEEDLFEVDTLVSYIRKEQPAQTGLPIAAIRSFGALNVDLMYSGTISKGLTDIPFGNYTLEKAAGFTRNGARRMIYRNQTTDEIYVIFNVDSHPELWNEDETELRTNLNFGYSKSKNKVFLYQ